MKAASNKDISNLHNNVVSTSVVVAAGYFDVLGKRRKGHPGDCYALELSTGTSQLSTTFKEAKRRSACIAYLRRPYCSLTQHKYQVCVNWGLDEQITA